MVRYLKKKYWFKDNGTTFFRNELIDMNEVILDYGNYVDEEDM